MARRSKEYDADLAEDLEEPWFVRRQLKGAVDSGVPLQEALGELIRTMGVKEFAEKVGMPSPNVLRAIDPKHNPTQETLERLLKPFGLRLGLAETKKAKGRAKTRRKSR
ncbi:MAG TPA: hypothetical protein VH062_16255 [Polyangiaceae bacterium]|nr:hypothetical protein [Polyangiaceae bacterium]